MSLFLSSNAPSLFLMHLSSFTSLSYCSIEKTVKEYFLHLTQFAFQSCPQFFFILFFTLAHILQYSDILFSVLLLFKLLLAFGMDSHCASRIAFLSCPTFHAKSCSHEVIPSLYKIHSQDHYIAPDTEFISLC